MKFLFFLLLSINSVYAQSNMQLINWFAGADIVGTTGHAPSDQASDFWVREFELSAYSDIDQTWEGILTFAYHRELAANTEHMEVHEAFLNSSKLFPLTNIKIGKFFLGFGRLNRFHRHDWIFTEAPLVQRSFFGNEGVKDTGLEYKRILPSLGSTFTLGITKGDEFNHNHNHDEDEDEHSHRESAKAPTAYLRMAKFFEYSTTEGIEVALNAINRHDAESIVYQYAGLDLIYKKRVGRYVDTLIQTEIWSRTATHNEDAGDEKFNDIGGYFYFQKGIDQHHSYGLRFDYYKPDSHVEEESHDHSIDGLTPHHEFKALSLSYIYTNSEFMRTRLTLEHGVGIEVEDDADIDSFTKAMLQFVFSIGAHPAHIY